MVAGMTDAEIAAKLTKTQRALLAGDFAYPFSSRSFGQLRGALVGKGIFHTGGGLTPLGLRIRALLKETNDE